MAEQLLYASLRVQDEWHRGPASEEAPSPPLEVNSARQTPLQRSHQSGHGGEKKRVRRERETHTHTHTHTPLHVPRAPAYMCTHTCTTDVAQRKQCTVQPSGAPGWSRARGKGGQEIPHPLGELGQVSPEGLGCSTEGCGGHRAPKSLSQGRGTWAQSHTPHTHTHKCMPPCALGAQMPYLVDCSPW